MPRQLRWPVVAMALLLALGGIAARPVSDEWYLDLHPNALTHGVVLGAVGDTRVVAWARSERPGTLQLEVKMADSEWPGALYGPVVLASDRDLSGIITAGGLSPATSYDYRPWLDGIPVDGGGTFRTLPATSRPGRFRFALGGDLSAQFAPFSILDRVREQRPDFAILLGDLVYADQPSLPLSSAQAYEDRYRATWRDAAFGRLTRDVPSFMMWDDHEIENDFDAGQTDRYRAARVAFDTYVSDHNPPPDRVGELYYSFQAADVDFFALDTRSHRSADSMPDGPDKTLLGNQQRVDLEAWLLNSRAPFKVILSSVPMHDFAEGSDAWSAFATERRNLLEFVRDNAIKGVVVLSGDQHWSSLVRHDPYGVWEFNATPLAQGLHKPRATSAPGLVLAYAESRAFGIVDVDTTAPEPAMTFTILDPEGQVRGTYTIRSSRS